MRLSFHLLLLLCMIAVATHAQNNPSPSLNIGDPAPPLRVREWIKGVPVQRFQKGNVYVVEFWATWCGYCIEAMPHLSALAAEYKDKITVLGIDILEIKTTSLGKIKAFVDSMGQRMDYGVAAEDSNFMAAIWLHAAGEWGIPQSFVVNAEGKIAWIGHPKDLDEVLSKIANHTWNIEEALAKRNELLARRNEQERLWKLDTAANEILNKYVGDPNKPYDLGKPDSALLMIDQIVTKEPKLRYAPFTAYHTFCSLLKTDQHKAYEYGKVMMVTSTYTEPDYQAIIDAIQWYAEKNDLVTPSPEIYELGAEGYQAKIDHYPSWSKDFAKTYIKMADWYWHAKNKSKAVEAAQKAAEAMKSE